MEDLCVIHDDEMSNYQEQIQIDPRDLAVKVPAPSQFDTGQNIPELVEKVVEINVQSQQEPSMADELEEEKMKVEKLEAENDALRRKVEELECEIHKLKFVKAIPPPPPPPPSTPYTPATPRHAHLQSHNPFAALAQVFKFRTKPMEKKKKYRRASYPGIDVKELQAFEESIEKIKQGRFSLRHVERDQMSSPSSRPTSPAIDEFHHVLEDLEHKREKRLSSLSTNDSSPSYNSSFDKSTLRKRSLASSPGREELNHILQDLEKKREKRSSKLSSGSSAESSFDEKEEEVIARPVHRTIVKFADTSTPTSSPIERRKKVEVVIEQTKKLTSPALVRSAANQLAFTEDDEIPASCAEFGDEEVTYF